MNDAHRTPSLIKARATSFGRFAWLAAKRTIHLRRDRLGKEYAIDQAGRFRIFRETVSEAGSADLPVVLVVGFRLRVLQSLAFPHWLFQRLCILTTPFWSGFRGFRVKLWMVDPTSKNYLGIYDWAGKDNAQAYVDALVRVLRPLSTRDSVWYRIYPDKELEEFLRARA